MYFFFTEPGLVSNFHISSPTPTSLALSWEPPDDPWCTDDPYRYAINYQLQQKGSCNPNPGPRINHAQDSSKTAVEVNYLEPFSNYSFHLRAINHGLYGRFFEMSSRTRETGNMSSMFAF